MKPFALVAVSALAAAISATANPTSSARCSPVSFLIKASAQNVLFSNLPDETNATAVANWAITNFLNGEAPSNGTFAVSGTYKIAGIYCEPTGPAHGVLEVIVHGLSYNKSMWTGLGYGQQYNWPLYAASQGYHSLTIDRLGHGDSEPSLDPWTIVQVPIQIEIHHQLVKAIKKGGHASPLPRSFSKLVYIGHSFGSGFGTAMADHYPGDFQGLVLTGFSAHINSTILPELDLQPAAVVSPSRYGGANLGYVTTGTVAARRQVFYSGDYDPAIPVGDFLFQDTMSTGEIGTFIDNFPSPIPQYTGAVMVVAGQDDALACNDPALTCDEALNSTAAVFPNAAAFGYYAPPNTGHDLTLHRTAPTTFKVIHEWIEENVHF